MDLNWKLLPVQFLAQGNSDERAGDLATELADEAAELTVQSVLGTVAEIARSFLEHLPLLAIGLILFVVTWGVARLFTAFSHRLLGRTHLRRSLRDLLERLLLVAIWSVGLTLIAMVIFPGLTPSKALAGLGLGSIAVGFAFKEIFQDFFAGVLILWRFPFENGDYIRCEGIEGEVVDVTVRNTLIRRVSGELVVVPNGTIFTNPVQVLTDRPARRVTVTVGVAYDEDVDESREVIARAVEGAETVRPTDPIEIFARAFGSSSIDFEVTWWTGATPREIRASRDEVVARVKRALDEAGIEIPFPYRTLTFKEPLESFASPTPRSPQADAPSTEAP